MNIKEELISRLKELLAMEGKASAMYSEMMSSLSSDALKDFFQSLQEEEKDHAKIVSDMIKILEES
ncbi:MAG: DUF892 family protein [Candidatus Aenigmarchaeota archaeon]|nr:DUF892 family protein [Candidatus Aenigmarchaeota archaeon]